MMTIQMTSFRSPPKSSTGYPCLPSGAGPDFGSAIERLMSVSACTFLML